MAVELEITRGDTPEWSYRLYDAALDPLNLTGVTIWFTAKSAIDDDDADTTAVLKHHIAFDGSGVVTSSAGFSLGGVDPDPLSPTYGDVFTTVADGVFTHFIPEADSTDLAPGDYLYDLQVKNAAGKVKTVIRNAPLTVVGDITRRTTTP